jgi:hypothetical protein
MRISPTFFGLIILSPRFFPVSNQRQRAADASGQVPLQFSRDAIEQGLLSFGNSAEAEEAA